MYISADTALPRVPCITKPSCTRRKRFTCVIFCGKLAADDTDERSSIEGLNPLLICPDFSGISIRR
jgi:hypothetical protein